MKPTIYIASIFLLLTFQSCQNTTKSGPDSYRAEERDASWNESMAENISLEDLPMTIREEIEKDKLFQELNISNITRIKEKDITYYDMTFKDADGQLIMVFYDEEGEIIVP